MDQLVDMTQLLDKMTQNKFVLLNFYKHLFRVVHIIKSLIFEIFIQ